MRPHFKRFFRSMAQKDLLLSDACLPFCGHSLLFFCRRFLFQIKRKCRNAGSIKYSIVARREGRVQILQFHIVTLPRQRVVEVADPYKLPTELPIAMLRCGYGKHDYRSQLITFFYIATVRVIDKSQFIKPTYEHLTNGMQCFLLSAEVEKVIFK